MGLRRSWGGESEGGGVTHWWRLESISLGELGTQGWRLESSSLRELGTKGGGCEGSSLRELGTQGWRRNETLTVSMNGSCVDTGLKLPM